MRQRSRKFFPRLFRIIMALQIEPALGICLEKSRKAQRGIGANRTLARNNFMNTPRRDSNGLCQCRLTNTQRLQPVFQQYFARMNQRNLSCHIFSSMIINNFDMIGIAVFPTKTNAPLVVNTNTVLSGTIPLQRLQPVSWRHTQELDYSPRVIAAICAMLFALSQ